MILNDWRCFLVLHIYPFLMPYDSGYTSLNDSETIILYNHIKQSVQRDILWFALQKIPQFYLIFWCENFVERNSFRIVSSDSSETLRKLFLSTKFLHQEIRWNYGFFCSVVWGKLELRCSSNSLYVGFYSQPSRMLW